MLYHASLDVGGIEKKIISSHQIHKTESGEEPGHIIFTSNAKVPINFKINIKGLEHLVWPNREGEKITNLHGITRAHNLTYPASASMRAFLLQGPRGGILLGAEADYSGKISTITLTPRDLIIEAIPTDWFIGPYQGTEWHTIGTLYGQFSKAKDRLRITNNNILFKIQVGLINPQGKTEVPDQGYFVLGDIAEMMKDEIGDDNILHVFGWSNGHDRDYPIFKPNERLGGYHRLKEAVGRVHDYGQKMFLYINPRIASRQIVEESTTLERAIARDNQGNPFVETYNRNEFYVMDPCSDIWIKEILKIGENIAELGIDGLELDQVAYQHTVGKKAGDGWGSGYQMLIESLQKSGLFIWTEGVSDIYPANWQQMVNNWDNPNEVIVSPRGDIIKGLPLGKYYPEFFTTIHGGRGDLTYALAKTNDVQQYRRTGASIIEINDDELNPWFRPPSSSDKGYLNTTKYFIQCCKIKMQDLKQPI